VCFNLSAHFTISLKKFKREYKTLNRLYNGIDLYGDILNIEKTSLTRQSKVVSLSAAFEAFLEAKTPSNFSHLKGIHNRYTV
jgi:hypothetical protein